MCFDLESNGLHGQAFAVGALIIDMTGKVYDEFTARIDITGEVDEWVQENVLPNIEDMQITHGSYEAMCNAFWRWFVDAQKSADYVLVSNGYPVEYRFLLDCQRLDITERYWQHPFPVIDLSSLLLMLNQLDSPSKSNLLKHTEATFKARPHHPLDDSRVAAMVAFEALKLAGHIS